MSSHPETYSGCFLTRKSHKAALNNWEEKNGAATYSFGFDLEGHELLLLAMEVGFVKVLLLHQERLQLVLLVLELAVAALEASELQLLVLERGVAVQDLGTLRVDLKRVTNGT